MLLQGMLFQDVFCCLCQARVWVDVFLQLCTRESASDLQTAFIMGAYCPLMNNVWANKADI